MAHQHVVAIDIGTTGAKAAVIRLDGAVVSEAYREYPCVYPKPNWVEQDVDLIVGKAQECCREAVAGSGLGAAGIAAVSISAQRCCSIFVDARGALVRPMISWQDNRAHEEVEELRTKISADEFYDITGMPLNTTWMVSKIMWVKRHEPQAWARVARIVQLQDYAMKSLGAEDWFDDVSDAGFYGLWDPWAFEWSAKLLSLLGLDRALFPVPTASGTKIGAVSEAAAARCGLRPGTPLCIGAGDQNSAAVGAGIVQKGYLSVSLGTGGLAAAYLDTPFRDPTRKNMFVNHAVHGKWQLEGLQAGAAGVFRWFRDEIATLEKESAAREGKDVYALLNEMIARTPPGAKGLVLLPYLASATTPRWNSHARGTLLGLTFAHNRDCLARCFMEGITMEVRDMVASMASAGIPIDTVRILGGATKSPLWNQMQADVYNRPVETLKMTDAALMGAGILAAVGIGAFSSIREGAAQMVKVDRAYRPDKARAAVYDEVFGIYCRAYEALEEKGIFRALADLQSRG
jgi:sugar (pentulose or hexulose) kinase